MTKKATTPQEDPTPETPQQRIERLQKEADDFEIAAKERKLEIEAIFEEECFENIKKCAALVADLGVHIEDVKCYLDLGKRPAVWPSKKAKDATTTATKTGKTFAPKYFNPKNPSETWAGVGSRPPSWILEYITSAEGVLPRTFNPAIKIENRPA